MMKSYTLLSLSFLLLIYLLVGKSLKSHGQSQASVIVNDAETISMLGLRNSPDVSSHLTSVSSLVVHAFGEASFKQRLQSLPSTFENLLTQLPSNVIFAFGEASYYQALTAIPTELHNQLAIIKSFALFAFADANYRQTLHYPATLINDTSPPQIIAIEQVVLNNSDYLRWNTDEFTTYTLQYGTASGVYTEQMSESLFAKVHLFNIMTLTPGQTYYARLTVTDRSGNEIGSAEFTIKRDTTQFLYLPLITK